MFVGRVSSSSSWDVELYTLSSNLEWYMVKFIVDQFTYCAVCRRPAQIYGTVSQHALLDSGTVVVRTRKRKQAHGHSCIHFVIIIDRINCENH